MNLHQRNRHRNKGSTLLISLFVTMIAATALGSYLLLATNQSQVSFRSQSWNCSISLVEAGVEEALNHCAYNSTNLATQGWALSAGRYSKSNSLGTGYYIATISTNSPYNIISTGYYPMPDGSKYLSRSVSVTTAYPLSFKGAMASKTTVDLNGNGVFVDSYDSRSTTKSTNGKYDATKRGDHADFYLDSAGTAFDTGNGNIWGHAYTGGAVVATTGPNGTIGDAAWNSVSKPGGIKPGWWVNTSSTTIPDVTAPFTSGSTPASGTVSGTAYDYVLATGNYVLGTLDKKCVVTGDAQIYVSTNISSSVLTIQSNATVKIYCAGASASFSTINNNGTAVALQYFGLPTNTSFDLGGSWVGGVYAPEADFSIAGNNELSGAVVAKSIRMRGTSAFHFDEALLTTNGVTRAYVTSWNEL